MDKKDMNKEKDYNLILPHCLPIKELKNPVMKCEENGVCTWVENGDYKING